MSFKDKYWSFKAIMSTRDTTKDHINGIFEFVFNELLGTRWIVNTDGELGIRVCGIKFWYYKWPDPMVHVFPTENYQYRVAHKREFGSVILSNMFKVNYEKINDIH